MRKIAVFVLCAVVFPLLVSAQETPQFQVFTGYSFLREDLSPDLKELDLDHISANGWHASISENVNSWIGGVADFSGTYSRPEAEDFQVNHQLYTFLFGPEVSYRRLGKVVPFGHVMVGAANARFSLPSRSRAILDAIGGPPPEVIAVLNALDVPLDEDEASKTAFSWAAGGGIDVNLNRLISIRTQVDLVRTHFDDLGDDRQNHVRVSGGIVFRFGRGN